jgi:opacity protein-like surface antigen
MNMKRIIFQQFRILGSILLILAVGYIEAASQSKVGTTAAQFLGIPIGARAISMGAASVATANDVSSIYYNPGAFSQARKTEIYVSTTDWFVGSKFRWLGAMLNIDGTNAVGLSITQLSYGDEEVTTPEKPDGTGEQWSAQDIALAISYCRNLTDQFSIGGSAKYISQSIWHETASTIAFDVGLLFITGFYDMRLGMSISNFGGDMKMNGSDLTRIIDIDPGNAGSNKLNVAELKTDPWPIPLFFRVGVAMDIIKDETTVVTVEGDAMRPSDNVEVVNVGTEVTIMKIISLRAGFKSLFQKDSEEGLTFGGGLKYDQLENMGIEVSYAYQNFGRFGNLNTFSVNVRF